MCCSTGCEVSQCPNDVANVRLTGGVGILAEGGFDRRTNRRDDGLDVAICPTLGGHDLPSSSHRAASLMPQHHDQRGMQVLDAVFDTADGVIIDDIAGLTHDEEVAQPLVKKHLRTSGESAQPRTTANGCWTLASSFRRS